MPDTATDAMEDMVADQNEQSEETSEKPENQQEEQKEEESQEEQQQQDESEEGEPEEKADEVEEDTLISGEDMKAIFDAYGEEEPPPVHQPPPPPSQQQQQPPAQQQGQPEIPQEILNVTPEKYMPQGQEYDPMDAMAPGSPSNRAALMAQREQVRLMNAHEREVAQQEEIARRGSQAIAKVNARMEREKWPPAMQQRFWNRMSNEALDLNLLADSFVLSERRALHKAKGSQKQGGGGEPLPVSKATRQLEKPSSPDAVEKEVEELFGARRELAI